MFVISSNTTASVWPHLPDPPDRVGDLTATLDGNYVQLNWSAARAIASDTLELLWVDHARNEDGFEIEQSTDGIHFTAAGQTAANVNHIQIGGLEAGVNYHFRVRAVNENSPTSAQESPYAWAYASASITPVDLRVDSNNDGQIDNADEAVEEQAPGAYIFYNGNSLDGDTIADLNDGYDADGSVGFNADDQSNPTRFSQVKLTLPDWLDWSAATIQFTPSSGLNLWTSNQTMRAVEQKVDPQKAYHPWELGLGGGTGGGTLWLEGIAGSQSLGDQQLKVDVKSGSKDAGQDRVKATVPQVDLVLDGLPEETQAAPNELDPRRFIRPNIDNDNKNYDANNNEILDKDETGPVAGENDLVRLELHPSPLFNSGQIELSLNEAAKQKVKIWQNQEKGGQPILGVGVTESSKIWALGQQPEVLWVEAVADSEAIGDIRFTLTQRPDQANAPAFSDLAVATAHENDYRIGFYGAGTGGFGNEWLEAIARDGGVLKQRLYGSEDLRDALADFITWLDINGDHIITADEINPVTVRVVGYSRGGISAINFTRAVDHPAVDVTPYYETKAAIPIQSLVTIDPETGLPDQPAGPSSNVQHFTNFYQWKKEVR